MTPHVLVTGAASGIGAGVCELFASADGARITAVDVRAEALSRLADRLGAHVIAADLADAEAAGGLLDRAWQEHGPVDVVVNAAGIYPATPFLEMTAAQWDRVQDVNVRAPMLITAAFGRACAASGRTGSVVNIASGAALRARPGAAHYCTSKAALEMLTKAAAVELGPIGVRVNAVSPGFVTVDSAANPVTEEYAAAVSANPLGRRGLPPDVAAAVRWLSGAEAAWVTGTVLRVDGGASAGTTALPLHWKGTSEVQQA
ncbi:SDR family NAD(P)-dependent oxidoreductase [Nonomuraea zeae]|uniref:SDR family oxidoreductase n=1 Tax=Nonomuraea zeae TaxID=1642303 RepID=A0A5S4FNG2_9ACTN|nr:SDR family oxidoreductase [Nonomuraea zeae]TMR22198.1 SDR family oxidoreductase [Nonomuraea zeae]